MPQKRVTAIDVCKGFAVLGMMFMNFKITAVSLEQSLIDYSFGNSMEGRFGVLFIFMAGVGLSLMTARALREGNSVLIREKKQLLIKRAAFLFGLGMLFSIYWQADILHYYGFYLLCAVPFLNASKRKLLTLAVVAFVLGFVLHLFFDWEKGWNFSSLTYEGFYHPVGFFRNVLFNGFHPLFPWLTFLYLGMYIGRSDFHDTEKMVRVALISTLLFLSIEVSVAFTLPYVTNEIVAFMLNTLGFPATPTYVLSSSAMSVSVLAITVLVINAIPVRNRMVRALELTGTTVMSLYVSHLLLGLPVLLVVKEVYGVSMSGVVVYTFGYYGISLLVTVLWKQRFTHGPLEGIMRKISG